MSSKTGQELSNRPGRTPLIVEVAGERKLDATQVRHALVKSVPTENKYHYELNVAPAAEFSGYMYANLGDWALQGWFPGTSITGDVVLIEDDLALGDGSRTSSRQIWATYRA